MPLVIEQPKESAAVRELKAKVAEVARRYAKQHNWCAVVDQALLECGITDAKKIRVDIEFTVAGSEPQHAVKTFSEGDFAGKTDEEMKAWVATQIAPQVTVAGATVTIPVNVIDLSSEGQGDSNLHAMANGLMLPLGYWGAFIGEEGRAMHIWYDDFVGDQAEFVNRLRANDRYNRLSPLCRADMAYSSPRVSTTRDEGRFCARCSQVLAHRTAA